VTEPQHNRRASDHPDVVERVGRVESSILEIKDTLNEHIRDETAVFREIAEGQTRLAVTAENQNKQLDKLTEAMTKVVEHSVRVDALEGRLDKMDDRNEKVEERLDDHDWRLKIIWWAAPTAVLLIGAAWTVLTYFKVI